VSHRTGVEGAMRKVATSEEEEEEEKRGKKRIWEQKILINISAFCTDGLVCITQIL